MFATRHKFTSLDLFAGAGGFSLGLEAAGFRSMGAMEIDAMSATTYRANFGETELSRLGPKLGDLTRIDPADLVDKLGSELDLIVAGPPCQGFSKVGRGKLDSLAERSGAFFKDPRNKLYKRVLEFVRVMKPRAVLLENVPGMLHLRGQNIAEVVCEGIHELGYTVRCALLNAAWYGVPQARERVFIIAFRNDLNLVPEFPTRTHYLAAARGNLSVSGSMHEFWTEPSFFVPFGKLKEAVSLKPAVTVGEALADLPVFSDHLKRARDGKKYRAMRELFGEQPYRTQLPPNEYCKLMRVWPKHQSTGVSDHFCRNTPRDFQTFARMKPGDRYPEAHAIATRLYERARARYEREGGPMPRRADFIPPYSLDGFDEKWRKLFSNRPSWTVTAHLSRDTYSHIHYDSEQARAITPREAARLQSFPDAYRFSGNMGDLFRQIGNAVPPLLAHALAAGIAAQLSEVDSRRQANARIRSSIPVTDQPSVAL